MSHNGKVPQGGKKQQGGKSSLTAPGGRREEKKGDGEGLSGQGRVSKGEAR